MIHGQAPQAHRAAWTGNHGARRTPDAHSSLGAAKSATPIPEPLPPATWSRRVYPLASLPAGWRTTPHTLAFHEAGHAVVAMALGLPCAGAAIGPVKGAMGFFRVPQGMDVPHAGRCPVEVAAFYELLGQVTCPEASSEDRALDAATMLCAGTQAELICSGHEVRGMLLIAVPDTWEARQVLRQAFRSETPLGYCQARARALLTQRWAEVAAIASELIERGHWRRTP